MVHRRFGTPGTGVGARLPTGRTAASRRAAFSTGDFFQLFLGQFFFGIAHKMLSLILFFI